MRPPARVLLVEYLVGEDSTLVFLLRADFDAPVVVPAEIGTGELRAFATKAIRSLDLDAWQRALGPLVAPVGHWCDEGDLVWLVPHDLLHYVPLHALMVDRTYLIERNPVCYTPSASVMRYCRRKRTGRRARALVLGDSRGDLVHARAEAHRVAALFESEVYYGQQATKTAVLRRLHEDTRKLDILHFSCHGYFDGNQPLRSGIALAPEDTAADGQDAVLTSAEIFGLELHADLVTLSACNSGVNERRPGDELIGLTRALIYAGTPSVVVSLWAVDDLSTALLMRHFYASLTGRADAGGGVTKAQALQAAQRHVMKLSAADIVRYCDEQIAEIAPDADEEQRLSLQLDRANAQAAASDLGPAIATYQHVAERLSRLGGSRADRLGPAVQRRRDLLEFGAESRPMIDYSMAPFSHPHYWAPFILVGDWV